jgi:hypothetical protein
MMSNLGPLITFLFYGSTSFCFIIYSIIFVKDTSFRYENVSEVVNSQISKVQPIENMSSLKLIKGKSVNKKIYLSK